MNASIENMWTLLKIELGLFFLLKKIMINCADLKLTSYLIASKSLRMDT
jgi:hypothetical protein